MEEIALMLKERSKQISVESRAALKKVLEQRTRLFALNIPEFTSLSSHDQVRDISTFGHLNTTFGSYICHYNTQNVCSLNIFIFLAFKNLLVLIPTQTTKCPTSVFSNHFKFSVIMFLFKLKLLNFFLHFLPDNVVKRNCLFWLTETVNSQQFVFSLLNVFSIFFQIILLDELTSFG